MSEVKTHAISITEANQMYPEVLEAVKAVARQQFKSVYGFPPHTQVVMTEAEKTSDLLVTEGQECPECEGTGIIWDETACGDPDHCSPTFECAACEGTGGMKAATEPSNKEQS